MSARHATTLEGADDEELAALAAELEPSPYRPLRRIADGGMARVYEVEHRGLRRRLAMKLLLEPERAELDERLRLEAQALSQLSHPNLLAVTDVGQTVTGRRYVVSELLHGCTLADQLAARGPMPPERAVCLVVQALAGLGVAHRAGLLHRDVKPENLFLCDAVPGGEPVLKLLDFGIAKLVAPQGQRGILADSLEAPTADGTVLGTPSYISPEQLGGRAVDARADLYAVGGVLYALLCGRPPFTRPDPIELARAQLYEPPPPPSRWAEVPPALELEVLRALSKDPDERHADARTMADALERALRAPAAPDVRRAPSRENGPCRSATALASPGEDTSSERAPEDATDERREPGIDPARRLARGVPPRPDALHRAERRARRLELLAIGVAALSLLAIVFAVWHLLR